MKKTMSLAVIFSVVCVFVASPFAQPQQRLMRTKRAVHRSPAAILVVLRANQEKLGITGEQLEKIENLAFAFREKRTKMRNDNNLLRLELQKLMQDGEIRDYEAIKTVLSKTATNRHDMFIERLKLRDQIQNTLTPEQKEALKAMAKDRFKRRVPRLRDRTQRFPRLKRRIRD